MDDEKFKAIVTSIKVRRMLRHFIIRGVRKKWCFLKENFELHIYCTKKDTIVYIDSKIEIPILVGDKLDKAENWVIKNKYTISKE